MGSGGFRFLSSNSGRAAASSPRGAKTKGTGGSIIVDMIFTLRSHRSCRPKSCWPL
jgi:hypothetical protein